MESKQISFTRQISNETSNAIIEYFELNSSMGGILGNTLGCYESSY